MFGLTPASHPAAVGQALVAVENSVPTAIWHMLSAGQPHEDLRLD